MVNEKILDTYTILHIPGSWNSENGIDDLEDTEVYAKDGFIYFSRYKEDGMVGFSLAEWNILVDFVKGQLENEDEE